MDGEAEKRRLERQIAKYEELALEFSDASTHATILEIIEELRQEIRDLER
jgi:hypothetical protein